MRHPCGRAAHRPHIALLFLFFFASGWSVTFFSFLPPPGRHRIGVSSMWRADSVRSFSCMSIQMGLSRLAATFIQWRSIPSLIPSSPLLANSRNVRYKGCCWWYLLKMTCAITLSLTGELPRVFAGASDCRMCLPAHFQVDGNGVSHSGGCGSGRVYRLCDWLHPSARPRAALHTPADFSPPLQEPVV